MATKVTFTLDDETVRHIRKLAEQSRKPQSLIVREAVAHYAAREETLSEDERQAKVAILREIAALPPTRSNEEVDRELEELRRARREGWARPSD
jgi:predicted transcriptional regulator